MTTRFSLLSPPRSLILIHGAGSGPWVFDGWMKLFPGIEMAAIDLQVTVDAAHASMEDYVRAVMVAASGQPGPVGLVGWSMGGLVALMATQRLDIACAALLEPSPPGEVQGFNPDVRPSPGVFDPEAAYGPFPTGMRSVSEVLEHLIYATRTQVIEPARDLAAEKAPRAFAANNIGDRPVRPIQELRQEMARLLEETVALVGTLPERGLPTGTWEHPSLGPLSLRELITYH